MQQHHGAPARALLGSLTLGAGLLAGCSGGGGSSSQSNFQLISISVPEGSVWPINKRIELGFSSPINFATVIAGSTLQLKSVDGSGATAFYEVALKTDPVSGAIDKTTLILQPFCPLASDLSDAGLQPGSKEYQLFVPGQESSLSTIKSASGAKLDLSQKRNFFTPASIDPSAVFDDTQIGPPAFLPEGTVVQLGDGTEIPFVFSGAQHELPVALPLNLYSDPSSKVSYLVQINQAVDPSDSNLNDDKVRLEFQDSAGVWQPFQTQVELESNCALDKPGAVLRLTPLGILPQDTEVRVVLVAGFTDLVGEQNLADQVDFFAPTGAIDFTSLTPADGGADEAFEDFTSSSGPPASFQDVTATFDTPSATWTGGSLTAAFDFQGTGGPLGTFDWFTPLGTTNFNTDSQSITGGPDGAPSQTINVINGLLDLNDLYVRPGSTVRVAPGDNPLVIVATGDVIIEGTLDISGFDAKAVFTLFTPNQPEPGALGPAGGGTGGTGSPLTSASDPVGGTGDGAFGAENAGGRGGETGFDATDKQKRRGAGGGGGGFGPDFGTAAGEQATAGDPGHPNGKGALSGGSAPAQGGLPGDGPFVDASSANDFFGRQAVFTAGVLTGVVQGELGFPSAGAGGGAGGDAIASDTFPTIPFFDPATGYIDKKGAGGGGGGGQLQIIALGRIIFRPGGRILCGGGGGNTGENVLGFDHIAGSSGGGSGGHVILQSATQIDFTNGGVTTTAQEYIQTRGGIGGIGEEVTADDLTKHDASTGGNGGPGVVQLQVPDTNPATAVGSLATSSIRVPTGTDLEDMSAPAGVILIPSFGARSKARSIWIPVGSAAVSPGGGLDPLLFAFGGTDPSPVSLTAGQVLTSSEQVVELPSLLGPEPLGAAAPDAFVDADGFTLVLSQASIQPLISDVGTPSDDIYLRNPALLRNFILRLDGTTDEQDFNVASGSYSDATVVLRITVSTGAESLETFVDSQGGPGNVTFELIPRFFRARTGAQPDVIPDTAFVKILFQATGTGPDGLPDDDSPVVDWTPDISEISAAGAGVVDFFRWEVEFNLDSAGAGLTVDTVPISLDFLRVPFSF